MTAPDHRSRPSRGHETPIDGTATTRTDAAVRPHDADAPDALDAWLESVTANGARSIGHGNGRSPHHSKANGSGPNSGDTPLVATARQFHARIGDAEASHAADIPEAIIWERIMSSQLTSNQPTIVQQSPRKSIQARPPAQADGASEGRPSPIVDRFASSHPAFSAVLAAAVILAIVAVFRVIGAPPSGPTNGPTIGPGPGANPALAAASPSSSPTLTCHDGNAAVPETPVSGLASSKCEFPDISISTCPLGTLTDQQPADDGQLAQITPSYEPVRATTDDAALESANGSMRSLLLCIETGHFPASQPFLSPYFLWSIDQESRTFDERDEIDARHIRAAQSINATWSIEPLSDLPLPAEDIASNTPVGNSVFPAIPDGSLVALADDRMGAVVYQISDGSSVAPESLPERFSLKRWFIAFAPQDSATGTLLAVDEFFELGPLQPDATGNGSPPASPTASLAGTPAAQVATPVVAEEGTLLIDNGSAIVSRPLDGSPGTTLETYDQADPPIYTRTTVPDVVMGSDGGTAHNVRTGQLLGTNPYDGSIVIGPFWAQYTSQNPAVPVDARIVDLRTMESVGFFDLAGVDPVGLGPQWLIEGTESGTLSVGFIDRAEATGPVLTPTMLLIDGDLERSRVVPLWSPPGPNNDVLAFSPDGSLVAYLTGTEGNVVIRVETTAGEPIGDIPWPEATPVAHLVLADAQTLIVMSGGEVLRADLAASTRPTPIATYPDEIWNTVLSPDGSHLLFATLDPLPGPNGQDNIDWHWLDIGTGEVRPVSQATGGHPFWPGPSYTADMVMLWVPVGSLNEGTYRVLFVEMTTGAVTEGHPTGVTSGLVSGQATSEDGTVFAAYGIGSRETPRFRALDAFGSIPLNGQLMVFDAASQSVVEIPFPDFDIPSEIINPALFVSPDGRHIVLSVRWTDAGSEQARSWITTTDGRSGWTPVEGGTVIGWVGE